MEITITIPPDTDRVAVLGSADRNLKIIREVLGVNIVSRHDQVRLSGDGDAVNRAAEVISDITESVRKNRSLSRMDIVERINRTSGVGGFGKTDSFDRITPETFIDVYVSGRRVQAQTSGQKAYVEAMAQKDMVFCSGPAGTGKTYLAVAAAVSLLKRGQVRKLVLARPAVEAGERLGFLPGDMQQKVNPYLRPLLDALHDMMPFEQVQRFMLNDLIEIVPLAFMRGRTLNDAAIILDEAQNTTSSQMLMFLTRMGHGSKVIVTGDTSQIDLENITESGLIDAARRLRSVPGIAFLTLGQSDIVRHSLVQRIVEAYGRENTSE